MTEANAFGAVAPYYDQLMKPVPYRMWVGYYLLLAAQQDVHPKRILDIACGTGTMTEMMHHEGFTMAGFDLSPPMIDVARAKAAKRRLPIRYEVQDAARFSMGETYDAAYSFFDSLNNITEPADLRSVMHRVYEHLAPGGSWIFDLNTAFAFETKLFDQQNLRKNAPLQYLWESEWDPATRIIQVRMRFWYKGEEFEELHVQRAYEHEEILDMLAEAGFHQVRAYHSYTLNPPRAASDRLHYTALKPAYSR